MIKFKFEKETKNTIRFKEESDTPAIGTLYVQKEALKAIGYKEGQALEVTLSAVRA